MLRTYDRTLQWTLRHAALTMARDAPDVRLTAWLFVIIPRASSPPRHRGRSSRSPRPRRTLSFDAMGTSSGRRRRSSCSSLYRPDHVLDRRLDDQRRPQHRTHLMRSSRAITPAGGQDHRGLRPSSRPSRGSAFTRRTYQPSASVAPHQGLYQYTLQAPDSRNSTAGRRSSSRRCERSGIPGRQHGSQIASPQITVDIDRDKASALRVTASRSERALQRHTARAVSTIYTRRTQTCHPRARSRYQRDRPSSPPAVVRSESGKLVRFPRGAPDADHRALTITHLGQLPAVTISFNWRRAYRSARRWRRSTRLSATRDAQPRSFGSFQGTRRPSRPS